MENIRDLFIKSNSYIVEYNLNDNLHLFIEGLNNGCTINGNFDIIKVENILVELHDLEGLIYEFSFNDFVIDDKLENIKDIIIQLLANKIMENNY